MNQRAAKEAGEEQSEPSAVVERLHWQLAYRADGRVAQALYAGEELEEMHESLVRPDCSMSFLCSWRKSG
jgi:hypothetical protein